MWTKLQPIAILLIFANIITFTKSIISDGDPHWVKYNPDNDALPSDAIVGGYENETLYIARAPHVGSLTPGKYVPSKHKAIISWGWLSHIKTEFEILCGHNYKWVPTTTANIPNGAVVGGYIQNTYEPLYVGRVNYSGQIIPGKVATSQGMFYFAYGDREIDVRNFEILVVAEKQCIIPLEPEYLNTTPLILNATASWPQLESTRDKLKVEPGQTLIFSCPSFENETNSLQKFPLRNEIRARCVNEDIFEVKDKSYKLSDLVCAQEVQAVVVKKHEKCLTETSELFRVGYNIHGFLETYEVCFDTARNISLYTRVLISKSNRGRGVTYNWYKYPGVGDVQHDTAYTCHNSSSTCCYRKTQLVNTRDVNYGPAQHSTFIDPLNSVMQWLPCDLSQSPWEILEESVRALTALKDEFKVWSGTHMLQDKNGTVTPRLLWKAVEKSMAVVYINGPSPSEEDILCTNLCGGNPPWPSEYKKHIYCCILENFLQGFGLSATNVGEPLLGRAGRNAEAFLMF